jgi:hypothetical protein
MTVIITSIKLRHWWNFFRLSLFGLHIVRQTKGQEGFLKMKNTGFGLLHFTMSAWKTPADAKRFAVSGAHATAMKSAGRLATEVRVFSFESDGFPGWKEAKEMVLQKGKTYSFR